MQTIETGSMGGKNKYQRIAKALAKEPITLIAVKDGAEMLFFDDRPDDKTRPAHPEGQRLLAAVTKMVDGGPAFYAKKPGVKVWDERIMRFHDVPVYDEAAKARTAAYAQVRRAIANQHKQMAEGELKSLKRTKGGEA